ncbi:Adenosylmethionine-8-amino-7-oxononanoate aminotransferase [Hondaea fermentalgiana]|uniref:Adenosylmethionine-8-amino-7-oxononanoate aminotransferase n=1 Tax=Hondaea fermentalgiana TaxID=2315210 RepID=A0A2R5GQY8_9STRA|nr:Adenosylmethionine-8-amino-7-oxononanoate aminotransferase [Hondaea fermentalgiana]|eukprot:GBG33270.1 Adenosylmethionine-8-amino-7-oxononanoate aminotransferase [Hondaea fermentalgiana]
MLHKSGLRYPWRSAVAIAGATTRRAASTSSASTSTSSAKRPGDTHKEEHARMREETAYLKWDRDYVLHPYTSMTDPLPTYPVRRAAGVEFELEDGRKLVDGMSSWWAAVHGYKNPVLDEALRKQIDEMSHVMFGGLTHEPGATLGKLLVDVTPEGLDKVFLCDSGSVAAEVSMKMAVQYWFTLGQPRKTKFLSLRNGYHGDTFGAMSVCDPVNGMHSMFQGMLAENVFVPSPEGADDAATQACVAGVAAALESRGDEIAAVILEPIVQGAGGMRVYSPAVLKAIRDLCDAHDVLLIFDEIATGFGRTGALFACEHTKFTFDPLICDKSADASGESATVATRNDASWPEAPVVPDIMCLGKALTGGYMTMGAAVTNRRVSEGISGQGGVFMHGPTFMGNPLASAVALASVNHLLASPWQDRVAKTSAVLMRELAPLADMPTVRRVRVLGAIGVVELAEPVSDMSRIQHAFVERGVWLRPFGKLLYTMPPFNSDALEEEHLVKIARAIEDVCRDP